jgi:sugar lactone lactonase YvrE
MQADHRDVTHLRRLLRAVAALPVVLFVCACGGGGGSAPAATPAPPPPPTPAPVLSLLAGDMGGAGYLDGAGNSARFDLPRAAAVDSAGNIYVADTFNSVVRKIGPDGTVSTFAGSPGEPGAGDGVGSAARFRSPSGIAVDSAGTVYVADTGNHTIRRITPAGVVTTLAGNAGISGSNDGVGAAARLRLPRGLAVSTASGVLVADTGNHTVRRIDPNTAQVLTIAGVAGVRGAADGAPTAARFNEPTAVALGSGAVYVADTGNQTLRRISQIGTAVVSTLAGSAGSVGSADGTGAAARFTNPAGVAVDAAGNILVADEVNNTLRRVTPGGQVTTLAGLAGARGSSDGTGSAARFFLPNGVAIDGAGNAIVADAGNGAIRRVSAAGNVSTVAGVFSRHGSADGAGAAAGFFLPQGVAADAASVLYVADAENHTIRKITPAGDVTTWAGAAGLAGSADGVGTAARFEQPRAVAVDAAGNVTVADWGNHTIRRIAPNGLVSTLAGSPGVMGSADGIGAAARFGFARGVAVDSTGVVYVADTTNHTIRRVSPAGDVITLAGAAGATGGADGVGAAARFNLPVGLAIDAAGTVYVADEGNHTIRRIAPGGSVSTLAGSAGEAGTVDGTGAAARLHFPSALAVDAPGNLYVTSSRSGTIRKITPAGAVSTVVGEAARRSFFPGALPGVIGESSGVAVSGSTLYATMFNGVARITNRP